MVSYEYSRWDGIPEFFDLDPEELMAELTKEFLHNSDTSSALRTLMQRGIESKLKGIADLLRELRYRRQQILENYNLAPILDYALHKLEESRSQHQHPEQLSTYALESGRAF